MAISRQRIPLSIAQTSLSEQNINRNQPWLNSETPMGPNAYDGYSNVAFPIQGLNNERLTNQSQMQNLTTTRSQTAAAAMDNVRTATSAESNAQNLANQRIAEATFANMDMQGTPSTMGMMGQMEPQQLAGIKRKVAAGKAQSMNISPDLGDYQGQVQQYS